MTDYRVVWKEERFTDRRMAYAFANKKRAEFDSWADTNWGLAYNDVVIEMTERPQPDGAVLFIVRYRVAEKIPFAQGISRRVDGAALDALSPARRGILTSNYASEDWDLRKKKTAFPRWLKKNDDD